MDELLQEFGNAKFPVLFSSPNDAGIAEILPLPMLPTASQLPRLLADDDGQPVANRILARQDDELIDAVAQMLSHAAPPAMYIS